MKKLILILALLGIFGFIGMVNAADIDVVNLMSPVNYFWTNETNNTLQFIFNWTGTSSPSTLANCSLMFNSVLSITNVSVQNNTATILYANITLNPGFFPWNITCYNSTKQSNVTSITYNLTIDRTVIAITSPSNGSWTSGTNNTIEFVYNWSGLSPTTNANCTLTLNSTKYKTNETVINASTTIYANLTLGEGQHNFNITCENRTWGYTTQYLYIDRTSPSLSGLSPTHSQERNVKSTVFSWTAADNLDPSIQCNLTVDGRGTTPNIASSNNTNTTQTIGLEESRYCWSLRCVDNATNTINTSTDCFSIQVAGSTGYPSGSCIGINPVVRWNPVFSNCCTEQEIYNEAYIGTIYNGCVPISKQSGITTTTLIGQASTPYLTVPSVNSTIGQFGYLILPLVLIIGIIGGAYILFSK